MSDSAPRGGARKGGRGGKAGGGGAGNGRDTGDKSRRQLYTSKRPVGGKGIFVTCVRGREQRAAAEFLDFLDEVADRLYPPSRLAELEKFRPVRYTPGSAPTTADATTTAPSPAADVSDVPSPAPTPAPASDASSSDDEDESIEASIARELAALKSKSRGGPKPKKARTVGPDGQPAPKPPKARFQSLETKTECLVFIAVGFPYDPLELSNAIVEEVRETGNAKTRYVQRLEPISFSSTSLTPEVVAEQSAKLIEKTFHAYAKAHATTSLTYQIEPSVRQHTEPLNRAVLIDILGSAVRALTLPSVPKPAAAPVTAPEDPTSTSVEADATTDTITPAAAAGEGEDAGADASQGADATAPAEDRPLLTVSANLKTPDLVLVPVVLKNTYGLGIVEGRLWSGPLGRKFNLEGIAQAARKRIEEERGPTAVRGVEVKVAEAERKEGGEVGAAAE